MGRGDSRNLKFVLFTMSVELSYLQLKTANDSRVSEELQNEKRKRSLLVLIGSFLEEEGFLDTLYALKKECGTFIGKYQVCDNIDLFTILQEYEAYYFVKFKKQPKIVKKVNGSAGTIASIPSRNSATSCNDVHVEINDEIVSYPEVPILSIITEELTK